MSRKGNCLDNAPMESFFGSLKTELVHRSRFCTRRQARAALFEYIEIFYNRRRRHSSVGYRTPAQARVDMTMAQAAEALGISLRTAERNWTYARTWLRRDLH